MAQKDIQDYLDKGMYGNHQIKPDEQKKYLGTFRERVVFIIRFDETKTSRYDSFCLNQFNAYPHGTLSINANCPLDTQNHFMKLAQQKNILFRLVDTDEHTLTSDAIAIVFSVDTPINLEDIAVKDTKKITTKTTNSIAKPTEKDNFFKRLFKF